MPKKVRRRNVLYREKHDGKRRKRRKEDTATQSLKNAENPKNPAVTPESTKETTPTKETTADIVMRIRNPANLDANPPLTTLLKPPQAKEIISPITVEDNSSCSKSWESEENIRNSVANLFKFHLRYPDPGQWDGKEGSISKCAAIYPMATRRVIRKVFHACWHGKSVARKQRTFKGEYLIKDGSVEQQLIADCMEDGQGYKNTTFVVNIMRKGAGEKPVGISTVRESYLKLEPEKIKIKSVPTANFDAHSNWAKATFNWTKQLAICYGVLDPITEKDPPMPPPLNPTNDSAENEDQDVPQAADTDILPPMFDRNLLTTYVREQVAWWDETHPKCDLRSSDCGNLKTDFVYRVRRQDTGKIDTKEGTYINCTPTLTKVKYSTEIRMALGVAMVKNADGTFEGRRCEPYDYTEKNITSEEDYKKKLMRRLLVYGN